MPVKELVYLKETPGMGLGIFAIRDIEKDEILAEFHGPRIRIENMEGIPHEVWDHLFNVDICDYIIAREPAVRTNHSCDPNAGIVKDVFLTAMRKIKKDEEVTFDYSVVTVDDWHMECKCGSPHCRGIIRNYASLPDDIRRKYENYTPDWIKGAQSGKQ